MEIIQYFIQRNRKMYDLSGEVCSVQSFLTRLKDTKEVDIGEVDSINCMSLNRPDLQNTHLLSPGKSKFSLNELSVHSVEWSELRHNRTMQGRCLIKGLDHHVIHQLFPLFFLYFHVFHHLVWYYSVLIVIFRDKKTRCKKNKINIFHVWNYKTYKV